MFTWWVGPVQCKTRREIAGCQCDWKGEGVGSDEAEDAGHGLSAAWGQPRPWVSVGQAAEGWPESALAVLGWLGVIRRLRVSTYRFLLMAISFSVVSDYDLHMG